MPVVREALVVRRIRRRDGRGMAMSDRGVLTGTPPVPLGAVLREESLYSGQTSPFESSFPSRRLHYGEPTLYTQVGERHMATTGTGQTRSEFLRELFEKNPGVSE